MLVHRERLRPPQHGVAGRPAEVSRPQPDRLSARVWSGLSQGSSRAAKLLPRRSRAATCGDRSCQPWVSDWAARPRASVMARACYLPPSSSRDFSLKTNSDATIPATHNPIRT